MSVNNTDTSNSTNEKVDDLKEQGNLCFKKGYFRDAISFYTQGLDIDPQNHFLYSNRSATYVKLKEFSLAMEDAKKLLELQPNWAKTYLRKGTVEQESENYLQAIETFESALLEWPNDSGLQKGLKESKCLYEKYEEEKKIKEAKKKAIATNIASMMSHIRKGQGQEKFSNQNENDNTEEGEEDKTNVQRKEGLTMNDNAQGTKQSQSHIENPTNSTTSSTTHRYDEQEGNTNINKESEDGEELSLEDFFDSITKEGNSRAPFQVEEYVSEETKQKQEISQKYAAQDLGKADEQIARILQPNLHPLQVLQLGVDASEDDIQKRYKKLSRLIHPDKNLKNKEDAERAFGEVERCKTELLDPEKREEFIKNFDDSLKKQVISQKYADQDLGTSEYQIDRIVPSNYRLWNLNPFRVLQLDTDASEDDIQKRFKRLSRLVHPDKNLHNAKAQTAFEEVERCRDELLDETKRDLYIARIEEIIETTQKDRKKELLKGEIVVKELADEKDIMEKAIAKGFAEIEELRLKLKRVQEADKKRAIEKEEEEKEAKRKENQLENEFKKNRKKRVEAWQEFHEKEREQKRYKVDTLKKEKRK